MCLHKYVWSYNCQQSIPHKTKMVFCPVTGNAGLCRVKNKLVQEGHGGITPTNPMLIPEEVFKLVKKVKGALPSPERLITRQKRLYELIWRRTLASQMTDSVLKKVKVMQALSIQNPVRSDCTHDHAGDC